MIYLHAYNSFNDTSFIVNTMNRTISPIEFFIGMINLSISASNNFTPVAKEISKALVSSLKYF